KLECDGRGRLIVIDGSHSSSPRDIDKDGFSETIALCLADASSIVRDESRPILSLVREKIGDWQLLPGREGGATEEMQPASPIERQTSSAPIQMGPEVEIKVPTTLVAPERPNTDERLPETSVPPVAQSSPVNGGAGIDLFVGHTVD